MSVVGLDFGTESCKIAVCRKGTVDIALNEVSKRKTPTVIGYTRAERNIGEAGHSGHRSNYKNTVVNVKRLLGLPFSSELAQSEIAQLTVKVDAATDDQILLDVAYGEGRIQISPEQVTAAIFGKLKVITEEYMGAGSKVSDVVISCPANWPDTRRRSLLDSAKIAGYNVLRLMNETTAVALNYGILRTLPTDKPIRVVFVDMGYAHTQAAVCELQQGKLKMLGHECDEQVGGRALTELLAQKLAAEFQAKTGLNASSNPKAMIRLRMGAEKLKKTLSANNDGTCNVECLMEDTDFSFPMNREQLEEMAAPYFQRITPMLTQLLASTETTKDAIHSVEIIGGGVRVPAVRKILSEFFGKELSTTCNGDESVARGCALQCAMLSPSFRVREFSVTDCTHYPVQLSWVNDDGKAEQYDLFKANNTFPVTKQIEFKRGSADVALTASYKNVITNHGVKDAIGVLTVAMPAASADALDAAKKPKVKVKVEVNLHGIVSFKSMSVVEEIKKPADEEEAAAAAAEADSDKKADESAKEAKDSFAVAAEKKQKKHTRSTPVSVDGAVYLGGLTKEGASKAFDVEVGQSNADRVVQETAEKKNELESYVYDMRSKLDGELNDFVQPEVKDTFQNTLNEMEEWLYDDGYDAQKSSYVIRIKQMRIVGDPIVQRQWEQQNRDEGVHQLKSAIGKYQSFVQESGDEKYAHISEADKAKVSTAAATADEWLSSSLIKQDKLAKWDTPAFSVGELYEKKGSLLKTCEIIVTKPQPKPEPKAEEPTATSDEPMADDVVQAEDEVEVENMDIDE